MSKERKRERDEPKEKGVPLADIGSEVIWDDPKLKVPFSSNPFISRMKGSAILNMVLSYGLYYNELTQKWTPLTSASITESLIKARFYPIPPDALTLLSDNPLRSDENQNLMVYDSIISPKITTISNAIVQIRDSNAEIKAQTDKLQFDVSNNLKCIIG